MRGYREHLARKDMNTLGMRFSFSCRFIIFPMPYDSDHLFWLSIWETISMASLGIVP